MGEMRCVLTSPGSHPDSLSGAGGREARGALAASQWPPGQKTEESNQVPRVAEKIQQRGKLSFRRSSLELHSGSLRDFLPGKHAGPGDSACFPPTLRLFFLVHYTERRGGTFQMEQARDVLTRWESKVKLFLSSAKEPFSKTPPNTNTRALLSFLSGQ